MKIIQRAVRFLKGAILSYGPRQAKQHLWDRGYRSDVWPLVDDTTGDCVYGHLEKFANAGRILDLGCGNGNTGAELAAFAYTEYVGVDISEAALEKARQYSAARGRADRNHFFCSDLLSFVPSGTFDVILFRESIYHIPMSRIVPVFRHYAPYLKENGVFMVRMFTADINTGQEKQRPIKMLKILHAGFQVLEETRHEECDGALVLVLRPHDRARVAVRLHRDVDGVA